MWKREDSYGCNAQKTVDKIHLALAYTYGNSSLYHSDREGNGVGRTKPSAAHDTDHSSYSRDKFFLQKMFSLKSYPKRHIQKIEYEKAVGCILPDDDLV